MPEQEKRYGTKITTLGAARINACILAGTKLKITQAAAGDGGGGYYAPTVEQTELVGELWRGPIVSAVQNPTVPNMLDVKIVIDDSVGNFVCREMGLFSEDGELIAICNTPDTEKVAISTGVDGCEFSERQRNGDGWGFVYEKRRENPKNALISRYSTQNRREIVKEVVTL